MDYIERMRVESEELCEKISKLANFVSDAGGPFDKLPEEKQWLMNEQLTAMSTYHTILSRRLTIEYRELNDTRRAEQATSE